ncbi:MAG: EpsG family protein [Candidatus Pacearchaeota archaeon]|nr:EpsG family protein [Candidatus Pacearchaeota archaeon]
MEKRQKNIKLIILTVSLVLILISLLTHFYGGTDVYDYTDIAKYLSGDYPAKIRSSHSYLYGFIHTPIVDITNSFLIFKITSLISLFLIIYSVYRISGRDIKALWLILLSPIVWYLSPWASPIQLASLFFLWSYHFIKKYDKTDNLRFLLYSGILSGLAWAFWDAVLFFIPLFLISFMYNKKLIHSLYFLLFIFLGVLPRLILDQFLIGFAFFGIIRHVSASLTLSFLGGVYNQESLAGIFKLIIVLLFLPLYSYLLFTKKFFKENKKTSIFIGLSFLLIIFNSQIRFAMIIVPIIILSISKILTKKQFTIQIVIFLILTLFVINPYAIQIRYSTNLSEAGLYVQEVSKFQVSSEFSDKLIREDLKDITYEYPHEVFVVGNEPDSYRIPANLYFGNQIKEFVSIEDYNLFLNNETTIFDRTACTSYKINERRDFCINILIRKAKGDVTDYSSISYALTGEMDINLENFDLVKRYRVLSLFKKSN